MTALRRDPADLNDWVTSFAEAAERSADSAVHLDEDISALEQTIRTDLVDHRRSIGKSPVQPKIGAMTTIEMPHTMSCLNTLSR